MQSMRDLVRVGGYNAAVCTQKCGVIVGCKNGLFKIGSKQLWLKHENQMLFTTRTIFPEA